MLLENFKGADSINYGIGIVQEENYLVKCQVLKNLNDYRKN